MSTFPTFNVGDYVMAKWMTLLGEPLWLPSQILKITGAGYRVLLLTPPPAGVVGHPVLSGTNQPYQTIPAEGMRPVTAPVQPQQ